MVRPAPADADGVCRGELFHSKNGAAHNPGGGSPAQHTAIRNAGKMGAGQAKVRKAQKLGQL
jgi:hypothetical protein